MVQRRTITPLSVSNTTRFVNSIDVSNALKASIKCAIEGECQVCRS